MTNVSKLCVAAITAALLAGCGSSTGTGGGAGGGSAGGAGGGTAGGAGGGTAGGAGGGTAGGAGGGTAGGAGGGTAGGAGGGTAGGAGGGGTAGGAGGGAGGGTAGGAGGGGSLSDGGYLSGPSKSSTISVSDDGALISMVNPENNSLSTFSAATKGQLSRVVTGAEPSAVVYAVDRKSAWVANRADATVKKVTGLDTASPTVGAPINVGSEPTGLALSPSGRWLVVTEWAEGQVSVIDTTTSTKVSSVTMRNPRAVAITNSGDAVDTDEKVVVTEFYGRVTAAGEATDTSRQGAVKMFTLTAAGVLTDDGEITFAAADGGFGVNYSPNQLFAVATSEGRAYIPAIGASPAGPPKFDNNIAPVVLVGNLVTKQEVVDGSGSQSLAPIVNGFPAPKFFLADLVDLSFAVRSPGLSIAYAVSRGGEVVQKIDYTATGIALGSTANKQIDLVGTVTGGTCFNPTGIVALGPPTFKAYVNCWGSQRLAIIDLATQTVTDTVASVPPTTVPAEVSVNRGRHFFFTGRGRWSNSAWSSCGSCHPDGLSDNMTWIFGAGPRQSTSMDGSYSHGSGAQKQRIFNWTGIIDEMHDFEGNTRGVQGGKGAVTTAATAGDCGNLALELQAGAGGATDAGLPAGLGAPVKDIADGLAIKCAPGQWDDIDSYARSIRPPKGRKPAPVGTLDAAAVTRGAAQFVTGNCAQCHGGPGWTVSKRFYTPSNATNASMATTTTFMKPAAWPVTWTFHTTFQIAAQPITAEVAPTNVTPIAPPQLACAIRNIGTFGADALELKPGAGGRAQGRGGYNPPSLYGLQVANPLLHHGGAATLADLFTNTAWDNHTRAGNSLFLVGGTAAADRADLIQYLWSIDSTTAEVAIPTGFDTGCQ